MTDNHQAGNSPPWSEEQQEEYLRRYRLTAKKERIQQVATAVLAGMARHGYPIGNGNAAKAAFYEAEALITKVDELTL